MKEPSVGTRNISLPSEEIEILKQKGLWPLPEAFRPIDEKKPAEHSVFESLENISRGLTEKQRETINAIIKRFDE